MSKTYRRKKHLYSLDRYEFEWCKDFRTTKKVWLDFNSEEFKKKKAHFHSDAYRGMHSAPAWYINVLEKSKRQKDKKELFKFIKNSDKEVVIDKFIKNAGWYFW